MEFSTPILSYVGSVDTNSAFGTTKYQLLFDPSLALLGNVIMFEYKLQSQGAATDPSHVVLNYVTLENANQTGIKNQYILSIPASNNEYAPEIPLTVQFRVYVGLEDSPEIVATTWSNALDVHVPPAQQSIYNAYYYPLSYSDADELVVLLNPISGMTIDGDGSVRFIVCYYYQDESGNTVWDVTTPIQATETTISSGDASLNLWSVIVESFGNVSFEDTNVYVSVHAVFEFTDSGNNYYSISEISETKAATPVYSSYDATLDSVTYEVYESESQTQAMDLVWTAPAASSSGPYAVGHYELEYTINDGIDWISIDNNIPGDVTSYNFDVSEFGCGITIAYHVRAVSINDLIGGWSNVISENIFYYAESVTNLSASSSYDGTNVTLVVSFSPPESIGCGDGIQFVVSITTGDSPAVYTIPYNPEASSYSETYTSSDFLLDGQVSVLLQTTDTNPPNDPLDGASASVNYIAYQFSMAPVYYSVYDESLDPSSSQIFTLEWSPVSVSSPWSVTYYGQVSVNGGAWNTFDSTSGSSLDYNAHTVVPATDLLGNYLNFQVIATVTDGSSSYSVTSNSQSYSIFKYSSEISNAIVDWALDASDGVMDLVYTFGNPSNPGITDGTDHFGVYIYDSSENQIGYFDVPFQQNSSGLVEGGGSFNVSYDSEIGLYTVELDNVTYASSGVIQTYTYVWNLNSGTTPSSSDLLTNEYIYSNAPFVLTALPVFYNLVYTNGDGIISGNIRSAQLLKPTGQVLYPSGESPPVANLEYNTNGGTNGFSISSALNSLGDYIYTFQINVEAFFAGSAPTEGCALTASNNAGVGVGRVSFLA